jgi:nitrate reductase cytochrome c-type subunit
VRLSRAERRLRKLASQHGTFDRKSSVRRAPHLTVSGHKVSWNRVRGVSTYVFVRKVPNQPAQYSVTRHTYATPPVVPNATVRYSVRTNVNRSSWAPEVSITYGPVTAKPPPSTTIPVPDPEPKPTPRAPAVNRTEAPVMSASGTKLSWNKVADVTTYVLSATAPGQTTQYTEVSGTSVTPAAVPGQTVQYSVRTAEDGSAWSLPVPIPWPAPQPTPAPPPPNSGPLPFQVGIVGGSAPAYELSYVSSEGAKTVRLEFQIGTSASSMESVMGSYAAKGIRVLPLAGFSGRVPTTAEAQNLGTWAKEFGPGGTYWAGKSEPPNTAVTDIEFGNETSYSYQFSDNSSSAQTSRATQYAQQFKTAVDSIRAANANVGLLAQGDFGNDGAAWMDNMFKAVPNFGSYVAGWTIHPYGPGWQSRMDALVSESAKNGAPNIPMWITEWGLATDNGRCLNDNYGFNKCMTYSDAASTLTSTVNSMASRYGSKLARFYIFQAHDRQASGSSSDREDYFGGLQSNGGTKGDYTTAVKSLLAK